MGSRGVLTKNYFIYPETVTEYGAEIERVMTETDRAMEEASEIIAKMASVTERIPSQIRSGELLEQCEMAQAEIRSFDFLSYGKRVNQGLLNLLDQNQYITDNFIKKMEATTERVREFGAGCRRLTELIDYSGGSQPLKGLALSVVSNVESNDIDAGEENLTGQGEETEEATTRENAILNGREILLRRLESDGSITDPNEIDWICTYIQLCQPSMLTNLYITDCYSSVDTNMVYNAILEYYNKRPDTPLYHTTENRISQISDFRPNYNDEIQDFLDAFDRNRETYKTISESTNVPIEIIAIIHYRENTSDYLNGNFSIDIENGKDCQYTEDEFVNQAINVFNNDYFPTFLEKYSLYPGTNDVIGMLCYMEVYNGLVDSDQYLSPYIYSGTPLYESGKYTEDHVYDLDVVDRQMGAYCLLLALNGQINYDE